MSELTKDQRHQAALDLWRERESTGEPAPSLPDLINAAYPDKPELDGRSKEARELKANIISEAKNAAKDEADKMIASAKVVIENEKAGAISELKNTVGSLSVDIAEKVLRAELKDVDKQNAFIADLLKDIKLN